MKLNFIILLEIVIMIKDIKFLFADECVLKKEFD